MNIEQERLEAIVNSFLNFLIKEHGSAATVYILTAMGLTDNEIIEFGLENIRGKEYELWSS